MKAIGLALAVLLSAAAAGRAQSLAELCGGVQFDVLPHPDSKEKFVVCAYEVAEVRTCGQSNGDPQCFDAALKTCSVDACATASPSDEDLAKELCRDLSMLQAIPSVDCNHFWICLTDMDPVYATCPQGEHFSRSEQKCVSPALASCSSPEKLCASSRNRYPGESCNEYYGCASKKLVKRTCPYGQAYSVASSSCVLDSSFSCPSYSLPDCKKPANANAYFGHSDCSKFYMCVQGQVYEGMCADGYGFDSKSSNCKPGLCPSNQ